MLSFIGSALLILKRQELKVMLYTAEDAIQIYHAKSSTLEFFAAKVPKAAWQGTPKWDTPMMTPAKKPATLSTSSE